VNAALWAIAVSITLVGITLGLVGLVLTQIAKSAQAIASQVGLRREAQDQRIDDLQKILFAHCEQLRHTHTPKRRKKAEQPTPTQS
jgi:cell division protein FtsX